jgi:hypothetical protein
MPARTCSNLIPKSAFSRRGGPRARLVLGAHKGHPYRIAIYC